MSATGTSSAQSWLARFVRQPQQLFLRRACFQIHLWAGILVSLYIAAIGISGSILVFKDELMPRPRFAGVRSSQENCNPASLIAAMRAALNANPGALPVLASCPTNADPFYQINVQKQGASAVTVYVDPETGRAVGELNQQSTWIGLVERFHLDLLLRRNGRQWNGAGAAILVVMTITGIVIWWPGVRNWMRAFKVNLRLSWKRINFDLHSAVGIWTLVFTGIWAVTGVYFAWETPFERAIASISPITTARYPEKDIQQATVRAASSAKSGFDLRSTLESALAQTPGTRLEGFFFGSDEAPIFTVYMAHGELGDYADTDFVYFNQHNGELLLTWYRGVNHTLGDWILWLFVPLHFGTSFGLAGKIIWAALGVGFPVLAVTGLLMYWNRWLSKQISRIKPSRVSNRSQI